MEGNYGACKACRPISIIPSKISTREVFVPVEAPIETGLPIVESPPTNKLSSQTILHRIEGRGEVESTQLHQITFMSNLSSMPVFLTQNIFRFTDGWSLPSYRLGFESSYPSPKAWNSAMTPICEIKRKSALLDFFKWAGFHMHHSTPHES